MDNANANIVALVAMSSAREAIAHPLPSSYGFFNYLLGKVKAAAFIAPSVETISAANELEFFVNDYSCRHNIIIRR